MGGIRAFISFIFLLVILSLTNSVFAQRVIHGRVTDKETGEPLPEAVVFVKKTKENTETSFDGFYSFTVSAAADSLSVYYIGYKKISFPIGAALDQPIDFKLEQQKMLTDVSIKSKENPAFQILRKVVAHKEQNNREGLDAYQYRSYVR